MRPLWWTDEQSFRYFLIYIDFHGENIAPNVNLMHFDGCLKLLVVTGSNIGSNVIDVSGVFKCQIPAFISLWLVLGWSDNINEARLIKHKQVNVSCVPISRALLSASSSAGMFTFQFSTTCTEKSVQNALDFLINDSRAMDIFHSSRRK